MRQLRLALLTLLTFGCTTPAITGGSPEDAAIDKRPLERALCPDPADPAVRYLPGSRENPSSCFVQDWGCTASEARFFDAACGCACVPGDGNGALCRDTCRYANDGECDDGGPSSLYAVCPLGTDCADCGSRAPATPPVPVDPEPSDPPEDPSGPPLVPLERVHVIGFGDSVTRGYCASPGRSYFELLVRDLDEVFGTVTSNNQAINATTSCDYQRSQVATAVARDVNTDRPTLLVITLGGNDLIHDYGCRNPRECAAYCADYADVQDWAQRFEDRMVGFVEAAQQSVRGGPLHVFLATIFDPTDGVGDIENAPIFGGSVRLPPWPDGLESLALYNETIRRIAMRTGAHVVDVHGALLGHGIHHDDPSSPHYRGPGAAYWYCDNLEDPNDAGYEAIRQVFRRRIGEVLRLPSGR